MVDVDRSVSIRCSGAKTYKLDELVEFQGNLKDLSEENYNKLKREILNHGFSEPIATWEHDGKIYILGGHQRYRVLKGLQAEGYFIPPIPCSIIQASDLKEAKEKVLAFTSQYGEITDTGLYEFMNEAGIDLSYLEDLRFPEIDLDEWRESYDETNFEPGTIEDQGQLDKLSPVMCTCPNCGVNFDARENPIKN